MPRHKQKCKKHEWTPAGYGRVRCVHCPKHMKQDTLDNLKRARDVARVVRSARLHQER